MAYPNRPGSSYGQRAPSVERGRRRSIGSPIRPSFQGGYVHEPGYLSYGTQPYGTQTSTYGVPVQRRSSFSGRQHVVRPSKWVRLPTNVVERICHHLFELGPDPLDWTTGLGGARKQKLAVEMLVKVVRTCAAWRPGAERAFYGDAAVWRQPQLDVLGLAICPPCTSLKLSFGRGQPPQALLVSFLDLARHHESLRSLTLDFSDWSGHQRPGQDALMRLVSLTHLRHLGIIKPPSTEFAQLAIAHLVGLTSLDVVLSRRQTLVFTRPQPHQLRSFRLSAGATYWHGGGGYLRALLNHSWPHLVELGIVVVQDGHEQHLHAVTATAGLLRNLETAAPRLTSLSIKDEWDLPNPFAQEIRQAPLPQLVALTRLRSLRILGVCHPLRLVEALGPVRLSELCVGGHFLDPANKYVGVLLQRWLPCLAKLAIRRPYRWTNNDMLAVEQAARRVRVAFDSLYALTP